MQPYAGHNLSEKQKYSITVYVGHEDTSNAPLVLYLINGEFFIQH